jgi:FAD binding domain
MPQWDHRADVVIVGTGAAACAAAAAAVDKGASVIMLEAADAPGGTTRRSGGAYWIPNNSLMRAHGFTDPRADAIKLMARLAYPSLYDPAQPRLGLPKLQYELLATFYDNASPAVDRLIQLGALDPIILPNYGYSPNPVTDPDYFAELPENQAPYGRVLTAKSPPGSFEFPGLYLSEGMLNHLRSRNVPILLNHRVVDVVRNGRGEVIGVLVEHNGHTRFIRGKRGVIFGTGGFAHDRDKLRSYSRGPIFGSCSVTTSNGAFVDIGAHAGAELGNLSNGFYYQASLEDAAAHEGFVVRPDAHVFFPYGDSTILVNKYGRRVVNEKSPYHVRTQSHFDWRQTEQPNLVQFMIWDEWTANEPAVSARLPGGVARAARRAHQPAPGPAARRALPEQRHRSVRAPGCGLRPHAARHHRAVQLVRHHGRGPGLPPRRDAGGAGLAGALAHHYGQPVDVSAHAERAVLLRHPRPSDAGHVRWTGDRHGCAGAPPGQLAHSGALRRGQLHRVSHGPGLLRRRRHDRSRAHVRLHRRAQRGDEPRVLGLAKCRARVRWIRRQ